MNGRVGKFLLLLVVLLFLLRATASFAGGVDAGSVIAGGMATGAGVESYREIDMAGKEGSRCAVDQFACVKAALYVAGGAALIYTAVDSKEAKNKLQSPDSSWNPDPSLNPNDLSNSPNPGGGPNLDSLRQRAEQIAKDIKQKSGIDVDTKTGKINTKKGPMSPGQLGSGAALADAGLIKPGDIAAMDAYLKKDAGKGMRVPAMNSSSGGGYSGNKGGAAAYQDPYANYNYRPEKEAVEKPKTAGLVKIAGGETIGASTGDIFEMIRKKYQEKTDQGIFVGQEPKADN